MLGNSNPTLAGDRLKETAISPARPVVDDCGHRDYGCDSRGPWSRRHGYRRSPGAFYRTPRVQRGTSAGGGGRHTRQSDLRSAVLGRRARCQAVGIWELLLLAAYDLQFVRGRRIFPVLRYRRHRRLGCDRGEMAARVGMARRLDCARNGYLFLFAGTSMRMEDLRFRPKIPAELNSAGANKLPRRPQRPETNGDSHPSSDS